MKPRRFSLRVQMASQYAAVTFAVGLIFVAVNFGLVERNTAGLTDALIGVSVLTVVGLIAGWFIAGYALKPLRAVTAKAQQVSATSLHQRMGLVGPDDELQHLATTFDALLARLELSFERERRFVANASHEIRTPLAVTRTALELGLASTDTTVAEMRQLITQALDATARSETLAADLLLLAQSESGAIEKRDHFDLGELTGEVINDLTSSATVGEIEISVELSSALMWGNAGLIDRLVANIIHNAIRHNTPTGWIKATTRTEGDEAILNVRNLSATTPPEPIDDLFEPFQRGPATPGLKKASGHGLGLSIVRSIALSHGAQLNASYKSGEIFEIEIRFNPNVAVPNVVALPNVALEPES